MARVKIWYSLILLSALSRHPKKEVILGLKLLERISKIKLIQNIWMLKDSKIQLPPDPNGKRQN